MPNDAQPASLSLFLAKWPAGFHCLAMESTPSAPEAAPELSPELRRQILRWLWKWCGRIAFASMVLWTALVLLIALGFRFLGETNLCTAFLLFVPPSVWLLPGLAIWPATLLFRWRAALLLGAVVGLVTFISSGWRMSSPDEPVAMEKRSPNTLVLLTNNRGQTGGHSIRPFKNHIQPDMMAFQESSVPSTTYLADPGYAEFKFGATVNEYTLISRFPVMPGQLLSWSGDHVTTPFHYGARFEVDWAGRKIAVYVVHLRSPRDALLSQRWGSFIRGIPLPFSSWRERAEKDMAFWRDQWSMAEALKNRLKLETLPYMLAGDFNAPHFGAVHRMVSRDLQDAHAIAGHGFGFTFPGDTRNPLAFGGPWMRIDHIFADPHWSVEACWTEDERKSQHRAVAAALQWKGDS